MKKILLLFSVLILMFTITGCGSKEDKQSNNRNQEQKQEEKDINNQQNNSNRNTYIEDDEIIEIEDEDNQMPEGRVNVEKIINCDGCVFAYFSEEGEKAKKLGDTLANEEYTSDINNIKTSGNKQRHNFFGLVLSGNTISKAYSCVLKDNKIYCIQGSTDGTYHTNNVGILNQIFGAEKCKTLSDGNNYWCTDGNYNGNSKTSGYTALHYETSCTIYGKDSNTGKLICH